MKTIIGIILIGVMAYTAKAQPPGAMPPAAMSKTTTTGHIYGKVTDAGNKALADVSVILLQKKNDPVLNTSKEVLLKGVVTKGKGSFDFEELPVTSPLVLKITASGFEPYEQEITFLPAAGASPGTMPSFEKDLGNIRLTPAVNQLEEVTVVSTKPLMKLEADKKVFNVEKNMVSVGGTAVDVMKNVPSVQVDIDGNVKLRNSAPQLLLDGRVTTLTLEQIPADAIESVEVMSNPSAKYDASGGGGGILNIVLKKNKKQGYNGSVNAGADNYGGLNGGIDLNLRQQKFNITASFNGRQIQDKSTGTTTRLNLSDLPTTQINQLNNGTTSGGMNFSRLGFDYLATSKTTFSLNGFMMNANFKPNDVNDIYTDTLFPSYKTTSYSQRVSGMDRGFNGRGLALGIKHLFPKEGEELTVDANYFTGTSFGDALYTTNYYNGSNIVNQQVQKIVSDGVDRNLMLQADYVKPFSAVTKLETGVRAAIRSRENNNYNYMMDQASGTFVLIPAPTSNYTNKDNVYAAYAMLSSSVKDFSYKIGLRAESSDYSGLLQLTGQEYSNKYPVSLFPSVFLSQKLKYDQDLQFSYSRRVNRPNFFQLIPFADSTDKLNITKGNPNLLPEFTQSFELSYMKRFKGSNSIMASVYYKNSNNLITRYVDQQTDPVTGSTALINTYINANSGYSTGLELTSVNYLSKWLDISTNINLYNSKVNASNVSNLQTDPMWSWFGKFNSNFKVASGLTLQLSAMYQSKTNLPVNSGQGMSGPPGMQAQSSSQGYIKPFYGVDLAIRKTFLKNNTASVTLSVNDIFRSRTNEQYSYSGYFTQDYSRLRNPQMFRLTLSYRFGKIDASLFKRKSSGSLQAGSDMMQQ
ncbi:MAG TPA: TonB-dependent receptor [Sediminibacterium sp.]|nr:TonB-dependent receptor [Sediminibacterium sp.]